MPLAGRYISMCWAGTGVKAILSLGRFMPHAHAAFGDVIWSRHDTESPRTCYPHQPVLRGNLINATPLLEKWSTGALAMGGNCTLILQHKVILKTDSIKMIKGASFFNQYSWQSLQFGLVSVQSFQLIALDTIFLFDDFSVRNIPWSLYVICHL